MAFFNDNLLSVEIRYSNAKEKYNVYISLNQRDQLF
jgi:hypothetical protein